MDLKSMKRKELQALCKGHGIPANTTNSQMIESLSSILQVKVKPKGCLKGSGGTSGEDLGFSRGGSKTVTFVNQDEFKDEEFSVKPVGKSKSKSIGRRSSFATEPSKRSREIKEYSSSGSSQNVTEVSRISTRSRGLSAAVVWSPVIEKNKKKMSDGTEYVRENAKTVPSTRSLRNRVIVAGGDEEVVTDQKPRKTQKRKNSNKEENENAVASVEEDEPVGRKILRKRSRDGDSIENEPPRRSAVSNTYLEETVATEEVDVSRANKRRKAVEKEIENANQGGISAAVVKKVQCRGRPRASKQGYSEGLKLDGEAVAEPTRRSRHSSSSISAVGKYDLEGDAVMKGKSQKQAKDPASLLPGSEALPESVRRSTRSSSAATEYETSLRVVGKSTKGGKAVKYGKSKKQANERGSDGGGSKTSFLDTEAIAETTRRSTRNSSLLENETSLPVGRESVEEGEVIRKGKSQKQGKARSSKTGVSIAGLLVNETITESSRRSMRSSSRLLENEAHIPAVRELAGNNEVIRNDTPRKKQRESDSKLQDSTSVVSARRSTRSSSKLPEDVILSPTLGKLSGQNDAVGKGNSEKQGSSHASKQRFSTVSLPNSEAVITPTRRSTRSSSKLFEDQMLNNEAVTTPRSSKHSPAKLLDEESNNSEIKSNKSGKQSYNSDSKLGDSTPLVPDKEAASTSARRYTRSSSKLLWDGISLKVENLGIDNKAANEDKFVRKSKSPASKQKGSTASVLRSPVTTESIRRSTRSSLKHTSLEVETSLSVCGKLDQDDKSIQKNKSQVESQTAKGKKARKEQREDGLKGQGSVTAGFSFMAAAQTEALEVFEQREQLPRRSTQSASKFDNSRGSAVLFTPSSEVLQTKQKKKRMRLATSEEDILVVESETVRGSVDGEVMQGHCFSEPASSLLADENNVSEVAQSPVSAELQKVENDTSLGVAPKDPDGVCFDSHVKEKQSSFMETINEGSGALVSDFIVDSSKFRENVSGQAASSNVYITVEAQGTETHGYDKDKGLTAVMLISSTMKASSREASVGTLDNVDSMAGMESQNITSPLIAPESSEKPTAFHTGIPNMEPNLQVEVGIEGEDLLRSNEATHSSSPQLPFKSSEELLLTPDVEISPEINLEEPNLKADIHDSAGAGLEVNVTTDIGETTLSCKSPEGVSPISDAEIYVDEPDKVDVDGPSEDVMAGSGATKIIDPVISKTESSLGTLCDLNIEESDSKVEVHVMAKGGMENSEDTQTAASLFSCKSTGALSPSLLPTLFNEVCSDINTREPYLKVDSHDVSKVTSHSNASLDETCDLHSETLEVSGKINALGEDTDSYSCKASLEVIKETWVSSTSVDRLNDAGRKNDSENIGNELKPSSRSESPAFDLSSGEHLREHKTLSSPEEIEDGTTTLCSHETEGSEHLTHQQGVGVNIMEHVDVDSVDRSHKSAINEYDNAEPLDVIADILPETADTTNKLTAVSIERSLELGAVVEGRDNIESLENEAIIEEASNNAMKNVDSIGQASVAREDSVVSHENFDSTHDENVFSKMEDVLSDETQLYEDNTKEASAEKENPISEELPSSVSFIPLPNQQERQESDGETGVEVKTEVSLSCNALDGPSSTLGEPSDEERVHVSPIEPESKLEATMTVREHTSSSIAECVSPVPTDTSYCEDINLEVVHATIMSEPGNGDADDPKSSNNIELRENSEYNTIIASCSIPDAKQGADQNINMLDISESKESSPAADQSVVGSKELSEFSCRESLPRLVNDSIIKVHIQDEKSDNYQGIPESFEQDSNIDEAWVARGAQSMFVDDLFGLDGDGSAQVSQWEHHEDSLAHRRGSFFEINSPEEREMGEGKMKAVAILGSSDAEREEACPYECEMSPEADYFLGSSDKPCADMDSQATYSAEQSGDQEERRVYIQETLGIPRFTKDQKPDVLDGGEIKSSTIRESKFDQTETMATVAKQGELIGRNCTELSGTNVADQDLFKESSGVERGSIDNLFKVTYEGAFTSQQHLMVSLDTAAVRDTSTPMQDESTAKDEIMASEEYFEDFDRSFADTVDFESSNHEFREVNSQLPTESTRRNSPEHSKYGFDMSQEQNQGSELDQIEESKGSIQSTPMQLVRNFELCPVIDDAVRNTENTVGLKMDGNKNHIEKSI